MNTIPLFKSQYSIGKSILTLEKAESSQDDGPDSIIDICLKNNLKSFFLIDDSMSGFLQGYVNSKESGIKMIFGLRLTVCEDIEVKNEQSLNSSCKYVIVAKNNNGYKRLIKIYSKASTEGFYYVPRIDFNNLSKMWDDKDLQLVVPFYDSFIHRNYLEDCLCPPPPSKFKIDFIKEDNSLPFDDIISEKIDKYIEFSTSGSNCQTVNGQSIYYKRKKDFKAYLTFRAIDKRTTLGKPNLEHMASDEFCFESWANRNGIKPLKEKTLKEKPLKNEHNTDKSNIIKLTKEQQKRANQIGAKRQKYNESINKKDAYGFKGNGKKIHVQGATAELAVALFLNQEWTDFKEDYESIVADVGDNIQVRSTDYKDGNLLVHPKDKDDQIFILVKSHDYPKMEISGWVSGKDAKNKKFWEDGSNWPSFKGRACYRFPHEKLNPIETLKEKINEKTP